MVQWPVVWIFQCSAKCPHPCKSTLLFQKVSSFDMLLLRKYPWTFVRIFVFTSAYFPLWNRCTLGNFKNLFWFLSLFISTLFIKNLIIFYPLNIFKWCKKAKKSSFRELFKKIFKVDRLSNVWSFLQKVS